MGKVQIITQRHQIILDEVKKNNYLNKHFYFTGGTALSAVYLQHRYSDDIDLFTSKDELDKEFLLEFITKFPNFSAVSLIIFLS